MLGPAAHHRLQTMPPRFEAFALRATSQIAEGAQSERVASPGPHR